MFAGVPLVTPGEAQKRGSSCCSNGSRNGSSDAAERSGGSGGGSSGSRQACKAAGKHGDPWHGCGTARNHAQTPLWVVGGYQWFGRICPWLFSVWEQLGFAAICRWQLILEQHRNCLGMALHHIKAHLAFSVVEGMPDCTSANHMLTQIATARCSYTALASAEAAKGLKQQQIYAKELPLGC